MRSYLRSRRHVACVALSLSITAACGDDDDAEHGEHGHADSEHGSAVSENAGVGGKASGGGGGGAGKSAVTGAAGQASAGKSGGGGAGKSGAAGQNAGAGGVGGAPDAYSEDDAGVEPAAGSGGASAPSPVTIRFKAVVGDQPFACSERYPGQGSANTTVVPQDFRLFVQDLALIRADGSRVPVALEERAPWQTEGLALLDFEDLTGTCTGTPEVNTQLTGSVPAGTYTGLSFSNGVPEALNHGDPTTAPDPLKTYASLSWGWLSGFRFVKAELAAVLPEGQPAVSLMSHIGSSACTGSPQEGKVVCNKPNRNAIELTSFDPAKDTVLVDIGAIFKQLDLTQGGECHGSGATCDATYGALGIDFATGLPKSGQTVFSKQ